MSNVEEVHLQMLSRNFENSRVVASLLLLWKAVAGGIIQISFAGA